MYEYRQIISRMRLGESDRTIAKAGLMGRNKAAQLRAVAIKHGWLNSAHPLPDGNTLNDVIKQQTSTPSHESTVQPYTDDVVKWLKEGITDGYSHFQGSARKIQLQRQLFISPKIH